MTSQPWPDRTALAETEIVARYVGGSHFDRATGRIGGSVFDRQPKDHDGLSFTRRGIFSSDVDTDRQSIREAVGGRMTLGKSAVFAELPVSGIYAALRDFGQPVLVCADPLPADAGGPANPAHALLLGLPFAGEAIGSLKAELAGDRLRRQVSECFDAIPR